MPVKDSLAQATSADAASLQNREIYNRNYSGKNLTHNSRLAYDRNLIAMRFEAIDRYGSGRDVLDLCCGSGSYLVPVIPRVRSIVGVDFSETLLQELRAGLPVPPPPNVRVVEADARTLPFEAGSFDFVFSFASLYYVPEVERVIAEIARVLRSGGHAVIELGNQTSLNTWISGAWHRVAGWARPIHIPVQAMETAIRAAGLEVERWEAMQVFPGYRPPKHLWFLLPFSGNHWRWLLGARIRGRMLDSWLSSFGPLKKIAFRHFIVLRKP